MSGQWQESCRWLALLVRAQTVSGCIMLEAGDDRVGVVSPAGRASMWWSQEQFGFSSLEFMRLTLPYLSAGRMVEAQYHNLAMPPGHSHLTTRPTKTDRGQVA
ncbi:hypothetical protein B0H10DRAFT_1938015 [Mycena sp. CBHHK59/15]|nr:hypothetical protein B0H10DRAFT_1938015 [Mycena sp. CBHHK59/15]